MTGSPGAPVDAGEAFTGSWELLAAPAPVVVLPPRSQPWGTAYCLSAATSGRRKGSLSREAPGERTTMFRDASGRPSKTPSRPLPRFEKLREVRNEATNELRDHDSSKRTSRNEASKTARQAARDLIHGVSSRAAHRLAAKRFVPTMIETEVCFKISTE